MTAPGELLPERQPDGSWAVGAMRFPTNAAAWRWIDRQSNEPISRAEEVGDWVFNRSVDKAFGQ